MGRKVFKLYKHSYNLWIVYKKTDKWYIEWQRVTSNDNEWEQVVQEAATNENEWQRVVQWVTTNDNE